MKVTEEFKRQIEPHMNSIRDRILKLADINTILEDGVIIGYGDSEFELEITKKYNELLRKELDQHETIEEKLVCLNYLKYKISNTIIDAHALKDKGKDRLDYCQKLYAEIIIPKRNLIQNTIENQQSLGPKRRKKKSNLGEPLQPQIELRYTCLTLYVKQLIRHCIDRGFFKQEESVIYEAFISVNLTGKNKIIWYGGKNYFVDIVYQMNDSSQSYYMLDNLQKDLVFWIMQGFTAHVKDLRGTSDFTKEYTRKLLVNDTNGAINRPS